jgi:tetratricopeptide (TPR) repeat protein
MDEAHRQSSLFAAGRLREKLKQTAKALADYQALRASRPAAHLLRLRGLVRLGLILEVQDKPIEAMGVYVELMKAAPRGGEEWKAAALRLEALSRDGSLVGKR